MYDRRNHAKRLLFGGLLLGAFAAVWLALAEMALLLAGTGGAVLEGAPSTLVIYDGLSILVLGPLVGLVLGSVVAVIHLFATRLAGKRSREPMWKARFYLALAVPVVAAAVNQAFRGPWISRLPGVTWIALGVGVVLLLGFWLTSRLVIHLAYRLAAGHASQALRFSAAPVLYALSVGLLVVDLRVLPRLYPFFHWMVALAVVLVAWMAVGATHFAFSRPLRRRTGPLARPMVTLILCTMLIGTGLLGHRAAGRSHRLRGLLFERTALASKALLISARLGVLPTPAPLAATAPEPAPRVRRRASGGPLVEGADVVLITVDALRADRLGLAGYRRRLGGEPRSITPNIDRVFGRGLRFLRAYCATPRTSYSVVSLLTGLPLHTLAQLGIERSWPTLPEVLAARGGYRTAGFYPEAIFAIDRSRFARYRTEHLGFQYFKFEDEDLPAAARTDQVIRYLNTEASPGKSPGGERFFLWVHYFDPHEPYRVRPGYEGFGTSPRARYEAELAYVDAQIGRLVEAVRSKRKRVLFVLTADHGEEFGEHGGANHGSTLYDEQVRVPLLFAGPGVPNREVTFPVSLTSVASTLLRWLGVPAPSPMGDAPDLADVLREGERYAPAAVVDVDQQRMVALGGHKLVQDRRRGYLALYDLKGDPGERHPLDIDRPGDARREASRLLGHLERRLRELGRLGRFGRVPDVGPLPIALAAADAERRRRAARIALSRALQGVLGEGARPALRRAVAKDPDPEVRHRALAALALVGEHKVAPPAQLAALLGRWDLPDELRLAMSIALARIGDPASLPSLASLLPRLRSLDQRLAVIRAMAAIPVATPESVDALAEALRDYEAAVPALRALARLCGQPEAADAVTRAVPAIYALLGRCPEHRGHRLEALAALACVGTLEARTLLGRWLSGEPEAALRARGLAWLVAGRGERDPALAAPLVALPGPGLDAPGGACLAGRGCRLEAAPVTFPVGVPAAAPAAARSIWFAVEAGPGALPVVTLDDQPLTVVRVPQARLPADGVATRCPLRASFTILRATLPAPLLPGRRARLALRDPSGQGVVVRGVALLPGPAPRSGAPAGGPAPSPSPVSPPSPRPGSRAGPAGSAGR